MIMTVYFGVITFIFGLVLGSFLNCTAMRIVRREDFVRGKSHCIHCGHELGAKDLVPLFSYISTKGKCRYCHKKISARYPITEAIFALLMLFMYIAVMAPAVDKFFYADDGYLLEYLILFLRNVFLTGCLFVIALVDLEIREVPDGCILAGLIAFLVTAPFVLKLEADGNDPMWYVHHVAAAIITLVVMITGILLIERILNKTAMGGGDIKLFALLALYLGYAGSYEAVLFSCIAGLVFAGIRRLLFPNSSKEFPFAPSIAISGYVLLIFSKALTDWYFGLFM